MGSTMGRARWRRVLRGGPEGRREIDEMKRRKNSSRPLCLGDLILAVSRYSDSKEETAATVADLLASGRVKIMTNGRKVRARVLAHSY
jgi:hypothetical protein